MDGLQLNDHLALCYNIMYDLYTDPPTPISYEEYFATWHFAGESWTSECRKFVDLPEAKFDLQRVNYSKPNIRRYIGKSREIRRHKKELIDFCVVEVPGQDHDRQETFEQVCDHMASIVAFIVPKGHAFEPDVEYWPVDSQHETIFWLDQSIIEFEDAKMPDVGYAVIMSTREIFFRWYMRARYQLVDACAKASHTMKTLPSPRMIDMYYRHGFITTGPMEYEIRRQSARMKRIQMWLD